MHTVFFDEDLYSNEESAVEGGPLILPSSRDDRSIGSGRSGVCSNHINGCPPRNIDKVTDKVKLERQTANIKTCEAADEDAAMTDVSNEDQGLDSQKSIIYLKEPDPSDKRNTVASHESPALPVKYDSSKGGEDSLNVSYMKMSSRSIGTFKRETLENSETSQFGPYNNIYKRISEEDSDNQHTSKLGSYKTLITTDAFKEESDDCDFHIHRDLFGRHFHKLASNLKVNFLCLQ